MKNYKGTQKGPQGKDSNRVVDNSEHRNAPAAVARLLIKEAHILLSDPLRAKVHAPAQGWKTYNKGIHTRTKSADMSEEIINLQRSGTVINRINSKRLATRRSSYKEKAIDESIRLFVELDLIQPLGRGLYAVGQVLEAEAIEVLIPMEVTLADLREIRSLKVTRNKQGELRNTNPYRRISQEWIRVRMALRLVLAYRQGAFGHLANNYLEKAISRLKIIDKLLNEFRDISAPAKSVTSWRIQEILKEVKTMSEELHGTKGFERLFQGKLIPKENVFYLRSLREISRKTETILFRSQKYPEKPLRSKSTGAFKKSNNSKRVLRSAENLQQQYIHDEHEATLRLMVQSRDAIYNLSIHDPDLASYQEAKPNVRKAVKILIQASRDSGIPRSDLAKSLFDFRKERYGRMPPGTWWGSIGFMEELGNITNWHSRLERVRREKESNPKRLKAIASWLKSWKMMSRNKLRVVAISEKENQYSDDRNKGIFILAYDQWREMKDEVEYRKGVELSRRVFITAQIEGLFGKLDSVARTGVVHFEKMLQGQGARVRVERYIDRNPSDMNSLISERRGELREMFEKPD